mmetsp:Transcript_5575/g.9968  ORF Transcript_5575/g.9968 Transcript_5575/m.9968 type:complete len:948 (+) Transcript_5575:40-2883(+)
MEELETILNVPPVALDVSHSQNDRQCARFSSLDNDRLVFEQDSLQDEQESMDRDSLEAAEVEYAASVVRSKWRRKAREKHTQASRRERDFVSWQARDAQAMIRGRQQFTALPKAPPPKISTKHRRVYNQQNHYAVENMEKEKRVELGRKQPTTQVRQEPTVHPVRVSNERVHSTVQGTYNMDRVDVGTTRVVETASLNNKQLSTSPKCPDEEESGSQCVEEEVPSERVCVEHLRNIHKSKSMSPELNYLTAIRGIIRNRESALRVQCLLDRDDLNKAKKELNLQLAIRLRGKRTLGKENKRPRVAVEQPAFLCGVSVGQSRNKLAWISKSRRGVAKTAEKQSDRGDEWEGSEFKIRLLDNLVQKLRYRVAFRGLSGFAQLNIARRRLCMERRLILDRGLLRSAWDGLYSFYQSRKWLRGRCVEKMQRRNQQLVYETFTSWAKLTTEGVLERGKMVVAETHLYYKCLWRGFVAWRVVVCVLARYDRLLHICATRWAERCVLTRYFLQWQAFYVAEKTLRVRLYLGYLRCSGWDVSAFWEQARVPSRYTKLQVPLIDQMHRNRLFLSLGNSLDRDLGVVAENVVDLACFGLKRVNEEYPEFIVSPVQRMAWRRQVARDTYICLGRVVLKMAKSFPGFSVYRKRICQTTHIRLCRLGLGRLRARKLRSHVKALSAFSRGDSLCYPVVDFRTPMTVRVEGFVEEEEESRICHHPGVSPVFDGWKMKLASTMANRKSLRCDFLAWKHFTLESIMLGQALALREHQLVRRWWVRLRSYCESTWALEGRCEELHEVRLCRRLFTNWVQHTRLCLRRARAGMFSPWSRWKRFARLRALTRRRIHRFVLLKAKQRSFRQWLRTHSRRRLLIRVFSRREQAWAGRLVLASEGGNYALAIQYRYLVRLLHEWSRVAQIACGERRRQEQLAMADIFYRMRVVSECFSLWKSRVPVWTSE